MIKKRYKCERCFQSFDRISRLKNHQSKTRAYCSHCNKNFCNQELLEKHKRSISKSADQIQDLDQKIQPNTGYGGDARIQAILLGKAKDISYWQKPD